MSANATRIVATQQDWQLASSTPTNPCRASVSNQCTHVHMQPHLDFREVGNPLNMTSKYNEEPAVAVSLVKCISEEVTSALHFYGKRNT